MINFCLYRKIVLICIFSEQKKAKLLAEIDNPKNASGDKDTCVFQKRKRQKVERKFAKMCEVNFAVLAHTQSLAGTLALRETIKFRFDTVLTDVVTLRPSNGYQKVKNWFLKIKSREHACRVSSDNEI